MTIALDLELADGALTLTNTRAARGRATRTPALLTAIGAEGDVTVELKRRDLVELRTWLDHLLIGDLHHEP